MILQEFPVTGKVIKSHEASYAKCLSASKGDVLKIDRNRSADNKWPGWLWCVDKDGLGSWVPEHYLRIDHETGTLLCDYDATELSADLDDRLTINKHEAGWYWCKDTNEQYGWIPAENIMLDKNSDKASDEGI